MKTISITIIITILIQLNGNAQNCSLRIHGFNQDSNTAYLGVHNYIQFAKNFDTTTSIEFQTTNGNIFYDEYGYKYKPLFIGKSIIKLFKIVNENKLLIDSCEVDIKCMPFTLEIGRHSTYFNDTIDMEKFELIESLLVVYSTNTDLSAMAEISEFELVILRNSDIIFKSKYFDYDRSTNLKLKNDLQKIKSNDKVHINGLKYSYNYVYECEHRNIVIEVK
jgi:hypothetical protein